MAVREQSKVRKRRPMVAGGRALASLVLVLLIAGCAGQSSDTPLPDLATQSPSKQPVMTPAEQKRAIDALTAKRDAQSAETAARNGDTKVK